MMAAEETAETGQESMGNILRTFSLKIRSIIRRTEKLWKKIKSKETSIVFNNFCIKERLLPKYTIYIYIYSQKYLQLYV